MKTQELANEVADKLIAGWVSEPPPRVVDAAVLLRDLAARLKAQEDGLVELQDWYRARGKTLHAHVVHNARQKLRRLKNAD